MTVNAGARTPEGALVEDVVWVGSFPAGYKRVIVYARNVCPVCGAFDPHVTQTDWPMRRMRCRDRTCNAHFLALDKGPEPVRGRSKE